MVKVNKIIQGDSLEVLKCLPDKSVNCCVTSPPYWSLRDYGIEPVMGAGTSALVALKQRKRFIGIEIKQEYVDMSYKRIAKVQQRIF